MMNLFQILNDEQAKGRNKMGVLRTNQQFLFSGGGFKYFLFSSLPGEMIQFD